MDSRGFPSMTALLGMLAVAGFQNRDKIAEMLRGLGQGSPGGSGQPGAGQPGTSQAGAGHPGTGHPAAQPGGLGGILGQLGGAGAAAGGAGGFLGKGLGELMDRFKESGNGETADSWVKPGPNKPCKEDDLKQVLGGDVLDTLTRQTGLSRDELLKRLCRELPDAVDKYTPDGRLPTEHRA